MSPREAAHKTMDEVGGAVVAIALVLCGGVHPDRLHPRHLRPVLPAVRADHRGLDHHLGLQLADAVAGARGAAAEAACATSRPRNPLARFGGRLAGGFNRGFDATSHGYARAVGVLVAAQAASMLPVYAGLLAGTVWIANARCRRGFIPTLDQGYAIVVVQLPDGSVAVAHRRGRAARRRDHRRRPPASQNAIAFAGFSGATFTNATNAAAIFVPLQALRGAHRRKASPADKIIGDLFGRMQAIEEAFIIAIPPPPVPRPRQCRRLQDAAPGADRRRRPAASSPPPTR